MNICYIIFMNLESFFITTIIIIIIIITIIIANFLVLIANITPPEVSTSGYNKQ